MQNFFKVLIMCSNFFSFYFANSCHLDHRGCASSHHWFCELALEKELHSPCSALLRLCPKSSPGELCADASASPPVRAMLELFLRKGHQSCRPALPGLRPLPSCVSGAADMSARWQVRERRCPIWGTMTAIDDTSGAEIESGSKMSEEMC